LPVDAPGAAAGEAVEGGLLGAVVAGKLVVLAVPPEAAVADAVGEREQDGDAAARGSPVVEEVGVVVEQVEGPAAGGHLPGDAVEAEGRPDLGPPAGAVLQDVEG